MHRYHHQYDITHRGNQKSESPFSCCTSTVICGRSWALVLWVWLAASILVEEVHQGKVQKTRGLWKSSESKSPPAPLTYPSDTCRGVCGGREWTWRCVCGRSDSALFSFIFLILGVYQSSLVWFTVQNNPNLTYNKHQCSYVTIWNKLLYLHFKSVCSLASRITGPHRQSCSTTSLQRYKL